MDRSKASSFSTVRSGFVFSLLSVLFLSGCAQFLGADQGLSPEDEPYLFDRWDPNFHLAQPCADVTEERLAELGLIRLPDETGIPDREGLDSCSFDTEDGGMVIMSGGAYKLAAVKRRWLTLDYSPKESKHPALAYKQDGSDDSCNIAAETPRGTVEVHFKPSFEVDLSEPEQCAQAENYFDLLIGEKLNEYRKN